MGGFVAGATARRVRRRGVGSPRSQGGPPWRPCHAEISSPPERRCDRTILRAHCRRERPDPDRPDRVRPSRRRPSPDAQAVGRDRSQFRPAQRLRLWSVNRERAASRRPEAVRHAAEDVSILRGPARRSGARCRDDCDRRSPARENPRGSRARGQGLLLREADGEHARGRQARARGGVGEQAGGADGIPVVELSLSAARARDHPQQQARKDRVDQSELELQRPALARSQGEPTSRPSASATRIGNAGCSAGPTARSIRACTSSSVSSRTSPAGSPISGTAMAPGWRTSISTPSSRTTRSRMAASSPGTMSVRTRTRSSASRPLRRKRCSTPTAPRLAAATVTTRY